MVPPLKSAPRLSLEEAEGRAALTGADPLLGLELSEDAAERPGPPTRAARRPACAPH